MKNFNKKYNPIQFISKNDYIEIYKATNSTTNEQITVKILNENIDTAYFLNNINKLTNLQNPNLININNWGFFEKDEKKRYYVEEEYFSSTSLTQSMELNEFTPIKYAKIIRQVAEGLREFHFKSLFWGNLSCDYIYVNNNGQAKLDTMSYFLRPNLNDNQLTEKDDIYSLCVILYQLLTKDSDFSLSKCRNNISDKHLSFIINKYTNKKDETYEDINDLIKDLDLYIGYGGESEESNNKIFKVEPSNYENMIRKENKYLKKKLIRGAGVCIIAIALIVLGISKEKLFNSNEKNVQATKVASTTDNSDKTEEKTSEKDTKKKSSKKSSKSKSSKKSSSKKKQKSNKNSDEYNDDSESDNNDDKQNSEYEENSEDDEEY